MMCTVSKSLSEKMAAPVLIEGNRGGRILVYKGYRYQLNKQREERAYWRCWRKDCRVPLTTTSLFIANPPNVLNENEHDHPTEEELMERDAFRRQAVEAVRQAPEETVGRTYNRLARQQMNVPQLLSIRSTLTRNR